MIDQVDDIRVECASDIENGIHMCSICLDETTLEDRWNCPKCNVVIHNKCFVDWYRSRDTVFCIQCNQKVDDSLSKSLKRKLSRGRQLWKRKKNEGINNNHRYINSCVVLISLTAFLIAVAMFMKICSDPFGSDDMV